MRGSGLQSLGYLAPTGGGGRFFDSGTPSKTHDSAGFSCTFAGTGPPPARASMLPNPRDRGIWSDSSLNKLKGMKKPQSLLDSGHFQPSTFSPEPGARESCSHFVPTIRRPLVDPGKERARTLDIDVSPLRRARVLTQQHHLMSGATLARGDTTKPRSLARPNQEWRQLTESGIISEATRRDREEVAELSRKGGHRKPRSRQRSAENMVADMTPNGSPSSDLNESVSHDLMRQRKLGIWAATNAAVASHKWQHKIPSSSSSTSSSTPGRAAVSAQRLGYF